MKVLNFKIEILASAEEVWQTIFTQKSEKIWPAALDEGTYFVGTWDENSVIKFLDQQNNGMFNLVVKNIPFQHLKMKHLGWILDGELSPQNWIDSTIIYNIEENKAATTLTVQVNALDEFVEFFNTKYPQNLE